MCGTYIISPEPKIIKTYDFFSLKLKYFSEISENFILFPLKSHVGIVKCQKLPISENEKYNLTTHETDL